MIRDGEIVVQQDAWDNACKESARYRHLVEYAIDWDTGDGTKRWMVCDQFYDGPTIGEAIDADIKERK